MQVILYILVIKHHFLLLLKPLLSITFPPIVEGLVKVSTPFDELIRGFVYFYFVDYDLKRLIFVEASYSILGF
jgi:hypothetical protein